MKKKLAPIPPHRWEVYHGYTPDHRRKQVLFNIAYCHDLQKRMEGKKKVQLLFVEMRSKGEKDLKKGKGK